MDKDLLVKLKKAATTVFASTPVLFAYLYGSRLKGDIVHGDYDIAIFVSPKNKISVNEELNLAIKLEQASGLKPIDLRRLNDKPLIYQGKVLQSGILIYSQAEDKRVDYERVTYHKYLDFLPRRKKLTQTFLKKVAQAGIL